MEKQGVLNVFKQLLYTNSIIFISKNTVINPILTSLITILLIKVTKVTINIIGTYLDRQFKDNNKLR